MSRRDMIIVAALINAGLLVVLFISAVRSDKVEKRGVPAAVYETSVKAEIAKPPIVAKKGDQIDQVLSQYSAKVAEKEQKAPPAMALPVLIPEKEIKAPLKEGEQIRTVTVEKGDVLEKIAKHHGISVEEIMKANNLANSRLQIGQVLKLPAPSLTKKVLQIPKEAEGKFYIVKGGDNPWTIAHKNGMQVEELLKLNNMDEAKAKKLRPGDKLRIK